MVVYECLTVCLRIYTLNDRKLTVLKKSFVNTITVTDLKLVQTFCITKIPLCSLYINIIICEIQNQLESAPIVMYGYV